jgi:hypothetical protein
MYAQRLRKLSHAGLADVHGLPDNVCHRCGRLCAEPGLFADLVEKKYLPESRAEGCADEYDRSRMPSRR